ncbi:MAG: transposase [Candidatus Beckwithbacteria bacterium]|nr:transposase [Patescibacteria group bacterium]
MPGKNIVKIYKPNSFYHIYNRGFNQQTIFKNQQDYGVFLNYLKTALLPPIEETQARTVQVNNQPYQTSKPETKNFSKTIELHTYCLMPNHYHFLIKQIPDQNIDQFMKSLSIRYTMYFNKNHRRSGSLFESRYKAILITDPEQILYTSKYIHLNPLPKRKIPTNLSSYLASQPSSYSDYLKLTNTAWLHTKEILKMFKNAPSTKFYNRSKYQDFIENLKDRPDPFTRVEPL